MIQCWKCRRSIDGLKKISFRALCPHCDIDLHVCKNCRHYMPGKPNDCLVPGTEFIRDREAANFCEDFSVKNSSDPEKKDDAGSVSKRLFGEELPKKKNPLLEDDDERTI